MYIKNRYLSALYKIITIIFCIAGQVFALGIPNGRFQASQLLYYTNQSNILCLIYMIFAVVFIIKQIKQDSTYGVSTFAPRFKGVVLITITITFLIYWTLLSGRDFSMMDTELLDGFIFDSKSWKIANQIVHLIVPLLVIFDWVLFDPKGVFKKADPFSWLFIPFIYYCFSLIVAQTGFTFWSGRRYPYFFIDSDALGWPRVLINIVMLTFVFILLGYCIVFLDWLFSKVHPKERYE